MNATRSKATDDEAKPGEAAAGLADQLAALRAEVGRLAERLGLEDEAALERARELAGDLSDEWRRIESDVAAATRKNPWRGLGIAALAGLILGLILRR